MAETEVVIETRGLKRPLVEDYSDGEEEEEQRIRKGEVLKWIGFSYFQPQVEAHHRCGLFCNWVKFPYWGVLLLSHTN